MRLSDLLNFAWRSYEQARPELDSEALDFRAASELFAPVHKLKRAGLETLRLVTKHRGAMYPLSVACYSSAGSGRHSFPTPGFMPVK